MKVLILGSQGQVGQSMLLAFQNTGIKIFHYSKEELSILDSELLQNTISEIKPNYIINCAAYTKVDLAEQYPEKANQINYKAVKNICDASEDSSSALIHFSTDYVYDGKKTSPYSELDQERPLNQYGRSKLSGDQYILLNSNHFFIFRIASVYSPFGNNFVKSILKLKDRDRLSIVDDQKFIPTSAKYLAELIVDNIRKNNFTKDKSGLYNFSSTGSPVTWLGFARIIFTECRKNNLILSSPSLDAISADEYNLPAKRPENSLLDNRKLIKNFEFNAEDFILTLQKELPKIIKTI